ncbi:MAG: DUF4191 family protein [Nostocoides sp.]
MADKAKPSKQRRRWFADTRAGYDAVKQLDPSLGWWLLGGALATLLIATGIGWLFGGKWWIYGLILGIPLAALVAALLLNWRGNRAMYGALDGRPGAVGAAISGLGKRGWYTGSEPVAMDAARATKVSDMSGAAMVYRAVGRPGIVLLAEGPKGRAENLLKTEAKKAGRVAPGVPVHTFYIGDDTDTGELPLRKVSGKLTRMRPALTKQEVITVNRRIRALGGFKAPIPQGMDPTKVRTDRKALRGK